MAHGIKFTEGSNLWLGSGMVDEFARYLQHLRKIEPALYEDDFYADLISRYIYFCISMDQCSSKTLRLILQSLNSPDHLKGFDSSYGRGQLKEVISTVKKKISDSLLAREKAIAITDKETLIILAARAIFLRAF